MATVTTSRPRSRKARPQSFAVYLLVIESPGEAPEVTDVSLDRARMHKRRKALHDVLGKVCRVKGLKVSGTLPSGLPVVHRGEQLFDILSTERDGSQRIIRERLCGATAKGYARGANSLEDDSVCRAVPASGIATVTVEGNIKAV